VVDDCIEFCGQKQCFSDSVSHLGHIFSCDLSDLENKTKEFIWCANSMPPVEIWNVLSCCKIVSTQLFENLYPEGFVCIDLSSGITCRDQGTVINLHAYKVTHS